MIELDFKYKHKGDPDWKSLAISNEEYFDLELNDEPLEVDSVPQYDHLLDYIDDDVEKVTAIFLKISDVAMEQFLWFNQTYWNHQRNFWTETTEFSRGCVYKENILVSVLQDDPKHRIVEILRISKKGDTLKSVLHSILEEDESSLLNNKYIDLE